MTALHHGAPTSDPIARQVRVAAAAWDLVSRFRVSYVWLLGRRNPLSSPEAA